MITYFNNLKSVFKTITNEVIEVGSTMIVRGSFEVSAIGNRYQIQRKE